jgi:CheY-like chemotaxis protein
MHNILIADDSRFQRELLAPFLNPKGLEAIFAVAELRSVPLLIVLDINMPGGAGVEVLERLRMSTKMQHVPLIVVSSEENPTTETLVRSLGAVVFAAQTMWNRNSFVRPWIAPCTKSLTADQRIQKPSCRCKHPVPQRLAPAAGRLFPIALRLKIGSKVIRGDRHARRCGSSAPVVAVADLVEFLHFFFTEGLLVAEQVRDQRDLREVLHGFHLHVGTFERRTKRHDAVIRHQDGIMVWNERLEGVGQLRRSRSSIAGQWDRAQSNDNLAD